MIAVSGSVEKSIKKVLLSKFGITFDRWIKLIGDYRKISTIEKIILKCYFSCLCTKINVRTVQEVHK